MLAQKVVHPLLLLLLPRLLVLAVVGPELVVPALGLVVFSGLYSTLSALLCSLIEIGSGGDEVSRQVIYCERGVFCSGSDEVAFVPSWTDNGWVS